MSGPSVYLTLPSWSLFKFPPDNLPTTLPPPSDEATIKSPFPIHPDIYNAALRPEIPFGIATIYILVVALLNVYNRSRDNKPWAISQTRIFKGFVILHNVVLVVFSAATFVAITRAALHTWPGFEHGPAGIADAFCKLSGPRGLGDAATFNTSTTAWEVKNKLIYLAPDGTPDPTDVGRLWSEGLAFWGWFFYLSKFYEVVDTLIILAKGRRSATLQTYHHAGAMVCMWAGIRYMCPPIWMFVFLNSGIHTMMYIYFTLSALDFKIPLSLKRTLTTLQIMQFIFGASYAAAHLFVKYDIPITTTYTLFHPIASITSAVSSVVASATDSAASPIASYGALLRRLLLRAAGDEGVAENVRDKSGQIIMPGVQEAIQRYREETRSRTEYHTIDCIDTPGQAFAIYLNIFYLAPLTVLFARFFVRAYTHRTSSSTPKQSKRHAASRSTVDAAKGVDREVDDVGKLAERKAIEGGKKAEAAVRRDIQEMKDGTYIKNASRRVSDRVHSFERKVGHQAEQARDKLGDVLSPERRSDAQQSAADTLDELKENVKQGGKDAKVKTEDAIEETEDDVAEAADAVKEAANNVKDEIKDSTSRLKAEADDDGDESKTEGEGPNTPSKKKRKNKKKKSHSNLQDSTADASKEPGMEGSSLVDVAAEREKEEAEN